MEYIQIGKVANTHGVRGDLKIFPLTDDITRFELLNQIRIENEGRIYSCTITGVKYFKNLVILQLKEIQDMNEALALKGGTVLIPIEQALPLAEDENYIFQMVGLVAQEEDGTKLGLLTDVMQTGAHDIYVIDDGSKHGLMIPATKEFIREVNVDEGYLIVKLIEGLKGL